MEMVFTSVLLGVGLAMDAFAVSLGVGTGNSAPMRRSKLRLALHFGIFQGLMTIVGWLLGSTVVDLIDQFDHWIAFGLLLLVGGRMISAGFKPEVETFNTDPSKGGLLILLSLATSMDALAVGLSMAMMSRCNHHIIANSSFSWWGAWLSRNNGVVIAPKNWFGPKGPSDWQDIYCEQWRIL